MILKDYIEKKLYEYNLFLNEVNKLKRYKGNESWYHASNAGLCYLKHYWGESVERAKPNPDSAMLMNAGTLIHNHIQKALEHNANIEYGLMSELEITLPELNVRGFFDNAFYLKDDRKLIIFDVKAIAAYKWKLMFGRNKDANPSINNQLQLGTLAEALRRHFGLNEDDIEMYIIYVNRDTLKRKYILINNKYMQMAIDYWKDVQAKQEYITGENAGNTPDTPVMEWECNLK